MMCGFVYFFLQKMTRDDIQKKDGRIIMDSKVNKYLDILSQDFVS
jgi:hypothetical protein